MQEIDARGQKEFDSHKLVVKIEDKSAGLKGFVAIHNDNLGVPAVGGTRMLPYGSEDEALKDALRLSKAMTYKCAVSNVPYGGGKAVIIGDPQKDKTEKLLNAYAKEIHALKGSFYTGEDVGISKEDVGVMLNTSPYFIGKQNFAGDPSPFAALSTFYAMQSAVKIVYRQNSLRNVKVAVKGVGKVGKELVRLLHESGSVVYVSDIDQKSLIWIKETFPETIIVNNNTVHALEVDVYSPCALGSEFSMKNAADLKAKIVCGAANNQLADDETGDWLFEHNVAYVPDYIANAGGLIDVVDELEGGGYSKERVLERIAKVAHIVEIVLGDALKNHVSPHRIADKMAENRFKK